MRYFKVLLVFVVIALMLSSCSRQEGVPDGYKVASNDIVDYFLVVPEDWTISSSTGAVSAYVSQNDPSSVSVMAWNLEETSSTPDEWWKNYQTDFTLVFDDFTVEEETETLLGGSPAMRYVYTAKLGENEYKFMQTVAIRKSMAYVFTYTALAPSYENNLEAVDGILSYFAFD